MSRPATDPLARYRARRNFHLTAEPPGEAAAHDTAAVPRQFVVQKHAASRLHYDFRLELDGVLVSWAVPKGPSYDPADKRMAIHVEDHPLSYAGFEGTIAPGQYGAGRVIVWDRGTWQPEGDPREGLARGKLVFHLHGHKLQGAWELVKIAKPGERQEAWLLFKKRDGLERPHAAFDVVTAQPDSVLHGPLPQASLAAAPDAPAEVQPGALPGARRTALPATLAPQLATLAEGPPATGAWTYEVKFDGYRVLARIEHGRARLLTRGGHDWSDRLPHLVQALQQVGIESAWLDGEIIVPGERGLPDFQALQRAFDDGRAREQVVYCLFDVPFLDGFDLRACPLAARRATLQARLASAPAALRFSADFQADANTLLQSACQLGLEGLIAKRLDAPYVSRRSDTWLKLKCRQRQEFVIAGFTDRADDPSQVGSLLLGVHDAQGQLVSVGSVGTGWDVAEARKLARRLAALEVKQAPFAQPTKPTGRWSRRPAGSERWVQPTLVAEVAFGEWTGDGQIRHGAYQGLREDKPAAAIVREHARRAPTVANQEPPMPRRAPSAAVAVTHGDRIIDPSTGLTKLDLVRYYESVAPWMLPHLQGRPVSLVRGPSGIGGQLFFQKHDDKLSIPGLRALPASLWPEHPPLLEVADAHALVSAAQMNVIEFHTWNAQARRIDRPDRMVFDLDPGEGTPWEHVQEGALLVRTLLQELGLQSWLKTSGGKGLHVVVPLKPLRDWDTVKATSRAIVQHLARTLPSRFVAKSGPANRVGKLFADYLRNGFGATTAAAFSVRARPGLGVSMPVSWDDLPQLTSGAQWTVANARDHLALRSADPWADYATTRQTLTAAIKRLGLPAGQPAPPKGHDA